MLVINLILISFSFLGFSLFIKEQIKISTSFIPFLYVCVISSFVYILALFSIMKIGIYVFDIILSIYFIFIIVKKKEALLKLKDYCFFLVLLIILFLILFNKKMLHYDNFSHWARISKFLIETNRLNNEGDKYILFNTYPQMSAYFIYAIMNFFSYSEFGAMFVNGFAILSGYFVLFSKFKKNLVSVFLFFILAITVLYFNTPVNSLLVDTLISTSGFASMIYVYENDFINNKSSSLMIFPIILYTSLIKNSSVYFTILIVFYLIYKYIRKDLKLVIFSLLSLCISQRSWSFHIHKTFTEFGKHSLDIESYKTNFSLKTSEDIRLISERFINAILEQKIIFLFFIVLVIVFLLSNRKNRVLKIIISLATIYIIYQLGNYYMYLYSMPTFEAINLASFDRYSKTIDLYLILLAIYLLINKSFRNFLIISISIILLTLVTLINYKDMYNNSENIFVKNKLDQFYNSMPDHSKNILIVLNEDKIGYYKYMIGYIFQKDNTDIITKNNISSINKDDYDYVIDLSK
ncbi:hypothetical protein HV819_03175 [Anaerococcus sp. AGMB00486]|uniref:Glycosyltransferase RgtA/B/C/D-like domain-containing protein n=1 Tax=Anaerococcus faecalis TaxID=2742993 RepID=A0ABX2N8J6_9FIRM|nr:hypothetical protein [Anaerococcus faecalis]NVF10995.1 hypothetical protein [Anaerococcus faecalis]